MHIQTKTKLRPLGLLTGGGAVLLLTLMLFPITSDLVQAWTDNEQEAEARQSLSTSTRLWNKPSLAVALADTVNLEITPNSKGAFVASATDLTVETNSQNGLRVLMNTISGSDLLPGDPQITASIKPLPSHATASEFTSNTWGYYVGDEEVNDTTIYKAVPTTTTEVFATDSSGSIESYNVAFGAKVDPTLPAGVYSNSVLVSVVANPIAVTLDNLTYMQEMQPSICEATPEGSTKQLIDSRDNQKYWVAKLKDGRCWMVQNLGLKIPAEGLSAKDTNVDVDWKTTPDGSGWETVENTHGVRPTHSPYITYMNNGTTYYPPSATETTMPNKVSNTMKLTTYSWNFGKLVLIAPNNIINQSTTGDVAQFVDKGLVNVSDETKFQPGFEAQNGTWTYPDGTKVENTLIAINCTRWENNLCLSGTYDEHYLAGTYYQWNTATAGTGGNTQPSTIASGDICPKGWNLPAQSDSGGGRFSYGTLLSKYGVNKAPNGIGSDNKEYTITENPLYFARSGMIDLNSGAMYSIGNRAVYWSATRTSAANSNMAAFYLSINAEEVYTNDANTTLYIGRLVRCVNSI